MKRLAIILCVALLPVGAWAQDGWIGNWAVGAAPAAAAAVPIGLPGVLTVGSYGKNATGVATGSVSLTVSGANTWMLFFFDHYNIAQTNFVPTWNGSSDGVTFLTNALWFNPSGDQQAYALSNPTPGTATAQVIWPVSAAYEVNFHVVVLTNCSGLGTRIASILGTARAAHTNIIASTTNSLVLFHSIASSNLGQPTEGAGQTMLTYTNAGGSTHASCLTRKVGTDSSTNIITWSTSVGGGNGLYNAVGF
jgi:hypothetical protein